MVITRRRMRSWDAALLCGALCAGCGSSGATPSDGAPPSDGSRADVGADRTGDAGVCIQTGAAVAPTPPDILIVMDRSGSMADIFSQGQSKWTVLAQAINDLVASTETQINWGLKLYGDDDTCGVNAGASVAVGPTDSGAIAAALAPVSPSGETPAETAIESAVAYLHGLSDPNPKYLLLASGGQMGCGPGLDPSADDSTGAESAVSTADSAGYPTFVLGVVDPTAEVAATGTLNHLAIVGGEHQQDTSTSFYTLTDLAALTAAAKAMVTDASCTVALIDAANAVLSVSANTTDGGPVAIPQDPADGWSYDASGRNLILNGSFCTALQASTYSVLTIRYACGG